MAESPAALTSEGVDISVDIEEGGKPAPNSADTLNTSSITSATANPQIIQPSTSAAETSVADSHAILADMATSNINSTTQDTQNLDTAFTGDDDDELSDGDIPPPPPSTPPPAHIINKSINSKNKSKHRKKVGLIVLLILVCAGIGLGLGFGLQSKNDSSNKDSSQAVNNSDNEDIEGEVSLDDDDVSVNGGWTTTEVPPGEENDVEEEVVVDNTDDTVEQPPEDVIVSLCACLYFSILYSNLIYISILSTFHSTTVRRSNSRSRMGRSSCCININ